jgi:L-2,4-diaminobutyrate decarboxylase
VAGVERADSVVWDPHKLMLMPALVSAVLFRDGARSYQAFAQEAPYLFHGGSGDELPWWDVGLRTLECTKRMLAFKLYAALSLLGTRFFARYVEGCFGLAQRFAERIAAAPDFELAVTPECNIVCFRWTPREAKSEALDALQAGVRARIVESGAFYPVQTRLPKGVHLRVTLLNPLTSEADLEALLVAVREQGRGLLAG